MDGAGGGDRHSERIETHLPGSKACQYRRDSRPQLKRESDGKVNAFKSHQKNMTVGVKESVAGKKNLDCPPLIGGFPLRPQEYAEWSGPPLLGLLRRS